MPAQQAQAEPIGDHNLRPENGPWLIVAATFSGDGAQDQARELALELRREYQMHAYVHQVSFDLADDAPLRGFDAYAEAWRESRIARQEAKP